MPTYDYVCTACGHEFETFQSIKAPLLEDCPACHKPKLKRQIGLGAGIIFKGGGFYETDYKRVNSKENQSSTSAGSAASTKASSAESTKASKGQGKAAASAKAST
jgi:putative FmdB family regulatory protein